MGASDAFEKIKGLQEQFANRQYGRGLELEILQTECRSSDLFRFHYGELILTLPAIINVLNRCLAITSTSDQVQLGGPPEGGWQHLRWAQNMSSALAEVCDNGVLALNELGKGMDLLNNYASNTVNAKGKIVIQGLLEAIQSGKMDRAVGYQLEAVGETAETCAETSTKVRQAFCRYRNLAVEVLAAAEKQAGLPMESRKVKTKIASADEEESTRRSYAEQAKKDAEGLRGRIENMEELIFKITDGVPPGWESVTSALLGNFLQVIPSTLSPMLSLAASGASTSLGIGMKLADKTPAGYPGQLGGYAQYSRGIASQSSIPAADSAIELAASLAAVLSQLYEYIRGNDIDELKFNDQAVRWLKDTLNQYKGSRGLTRSDISNKVTSACDAALEVVNAISGSRSNSSSSTRDQWKSTIQALRDDMIAISAIGMVATAATSPMGSHGRFQADVPRSDNLGQCAQISNTIQDYRLAHTVCEVARANFVESVSKQDKLKSCLAQVDQSLERQGDPQKQIVELLGATMNVLNDFCNQLGRMEDFYIRLSVVIKDVLVEKMRAFDANRGSRDRDQLSMSEISYSSTLAMLLPVKAYFWLLAESARMYFEIDRRHVRQALELMERMREMGRMGRGYDRYGGRGGGGENRFAAQANEYNKRMTQEVEELVRRKQDEKVEELGDKANVSRELAEKAEREAEREGVDVQSIRKAIETAAENVKQAAKKEMEFATPWVVACM